MVLCVYLWCFFFIYLWVLNNLPFSILLQRVLACLCVFGCMCVYCYLCIVWLFAKVISKWRISDQSWYQYYTQMERVRGWRREGENQQQLLPYREYLLNQIKICSKCIQYFRVEHSSTQPDGHYHNEQVRVLQTAVELPSECYVRWWCTLGI